MWNYKNKKVRAVTKGQGPGISSGSYEHHPQATSYNPVSPNSDQCQFSPNDIHTLSRDTVTRINTVISKEKMPWSFIKFSQLIRKENV